MVVYDFEFDGKRLSDLGMTICSFGDKGLETVDNGSKVSFNTVSVLGGSLHRKTSTVYEDCLEATIQICKYSCSTDVKEITSTEFRELTKWLNRKNFLKFKFLSEDYIDLYYEAKIDISRIELDGRLFGLELNITTNRPFALKEPRMITVVNKGKVHMWNKYKLMAISYEEVERNDELLGFITIGQNNGWYVEYSDDIYFDRYGIHLVSPEKIEESDMGSLYHYVSNKYIYNSFNNEYYRIPPRALFYNTDNNDGYVYTTVTNAYRLDVNYIKDEFIECVYSDNKELYPRNGILDDYYYVYVGQSEFSNVSISDISYEEGYIYPYTEIVIGDVGDEKVDLDIYNALEDRHTIIKNCSTGEVITMNYPIIHSSILSHDIQNDFNWKFFRIANTYNNSRNDLSISLPCTMKIKYSPIVKVGL